MKPNNFQIKIDILKLYNKLSIVDSAQIYYNKIIIGLEQKIDHAKNEDAQIEFEFFKALVFYEIGDKDSAVNTMKKIIFENPDHNKILIFKTFFEGVEPQVLESCQER